MVFAARVFDGALEHVGQQPQFVRPRHKLHAASFFSGGHQGSPAIDGAVG